MNEELKEIRERWKYCNGNTDMMKVFAYLDELEGKRVPWFERGLVTWKRTEIWVFGFLYGVMSGLALGELIDWISKYD